MGEKKSLRKKLWKKSWLYVASKEKLDECCCDGKKLGLKRESEKRRGQRN